MSLFRSLFVREDIWKQIAEDIGGEFIDGGFWEQGHVSYYHEEWEIILDSFERGHPDQTYTRMRAPFINKDGLYFKIYKQDFFDTVAKFFGMQDIEIGDDFFDKNFVIKGNNTRQIIRLFKDENLRALVERQPNILFSIRDDEGYFKRNYIGGIDELYFEFQGKITDVEQLKSLFDLFAVTLERLVHIDSAYPTDPTLKFVE